MKSTLFFLPAVVLLCTAATTNNYGSLRTETPPTWLPVPVAGVRASQLRDTWGAARSSGRTHEGIDIMAPRGTPVLSATHGVISAVQWLTLGGNTVSVLGPGGYSHYYAHLDSYGRHAAGEWVNVGDTLGYVGNTGNAQGGPTHLHYGIYTDSGAINPYPFLVARSAKGATPVKAKPSPGSTARRGTKSGSAAKPRTDGTPAAARKSVAAAPQSYASRVRR